MPRCHGDASAKSRLSRPMLSKGVKRKYSEVDGGVGSIPETAAAVCPSSVPAVQSHCLMNISLLKLHRSLRNVEPNLRHLVLVANTLRRLQDNMQAEPSTPGGWRATEDHSRKDYAQAPATECKKPAIDNQGDDPLLCSMDTSLYSSISTILEDLNNFEGLSSSPLPQMDDDQLCCPKDNACDGSREDSGKLPPSSGLLNSSTYLLGDNLEGIFEDIDTSMYDSDPWASNNLLNFKAFSNVEEAEGKTLIEGQSSMLELNELDYLMDVLVGAQNC
ncbi:SERTA domain-containing protein 1-like isoform X1 [Ascaphus truei]|uniref:SERTA domain-containing protein 1-like isoform X1 n=2 Tax=Ascaphus truei TaxID=8439 RepID=UPI003F592FF0